MTRTVLKGVREAMSDLRAAIEALEECKHDGTCDCADEALGRMRDAQCELNATENTAIEVERLVAA